jgi:type IV pilus assembly protein PilO
MTNLQDGASRLSAATLRRLWVLAPACGLGGLGLLVMLGGLVPLWSILQKDSQRLQELEQIRDQVTLLRTQLATTRDDVEKATASKAKIVRLITGNGDLSTFLAMLDREARATGVQLNLYEPTEAPLPAAAAPPGGAAPAPQAPAAPPAAAAPGTPPAQGAAPPPPKPLALEGLSQRFLLVSARGRFPELLAFLRRLEALNVLVVQSDLNLALSDEKAAGGKSINSDSPVLMKLTLGLYSRSQAKPPGPAQAAPAPAAAGAAPAPAPAPAPN